MSVYNQLTDHGVWACYHAIWAHPIFNYCTGCIQQKRKIIHYGYSFFRQIFNVHLNLMVWHRWSDICWHYCWIRTLYRCSCRCNMTCHPILVGGAIKSGGNVINIVLEASAMIWNGEAKSLPPSPSFLVAFPALPVLFHLLFCSLFCFKF